MGLREDSRKLQKRNHRRPERHNGEAPGTEPQTRFVRKGRVVIGLRLTASVNLGIVDGYGAPLEMTPEERATHLYVCGSTGTGKSKMLEHLIRQDIAQWFESQCGLLLLDPHGSLYDSLMKWIAWNEDVLKGVPIVPIDLRQNPKYLSYGLSWAKSFRVFSFVRSTNNCSDQWSPFTTKSSVISSRALSATNNHSPSSHH